MKELSIVGDRRMTVKEMSESTGIPERTIHNAIDRVLPGVKRNGLTTMLTEEQVAMVSAEVKRSHNSELASSGKVVETDIEMAQKTVEVIRWAMSKIENLEAELTEAKPKAAIADRIAVSDGLRTLTDVGKINGIGPRRIFELLESRRVLFRGADHRWRPYQEWIEAGYFTMKESTYDTPAGPHITIQTYVTGRGELWLAKRLFMEASA